jgi:hypothetical protein
VEISQTLSQYLDLFFGLPMHPLVVHGVVVLVPIFALYVGYRAIKNRAVPRSALLVGLVLLVISAASRLSGEALASRIGYETIKETGHLSAGDKYPLIVAIFLFVIFLYNSSLQRRRRSRWWFAPLIKGIVVVSSIGILLFTFWVGHTGAKSHWQGIKNYTEYGDYKP